MDHEYNFIVKIGDKHSRIGVTIRAQYQPIALYSSLRTTGAALIEMGTNCKQSKLFIIIYMGIVC